MAEVKPSVAFMLLIAAAAALGGFLFGFDTAVINGAVLALKDHFHAGDWEIGLAVSLALLGAAAGAFFAGQLADRFGRRPCMIGAAILFLISSIGSGAPFGIGDFIMWRIIGGIGVGAASVIAPAYIAETAAARMRGRLGSLQQLAIVIGIFAALISNYGIVCLAGSASSPLFGFHAWQWMFWIEAIPSLIYGIAAFCIPESPRHLVACGRDEESHAILVRLEGPEVAAAKVAEIRASMKDRRESRLSDLIEKGKGLHPIVWVGLGLAVLQQLVGINVIFYYGNVLWQSVGFTEQDSLMLNVISSIINIATTLIAIATVDRIGRKPLLLIGSIGMSVTLFTMAAIFALAPTHTFVALIAANLYIVFFGMSWGPIMWVMLGEMFPNRLRGAALALCGLFQWLANFAVSTTFPPLTAKAGPAGAYGIYAFFAFVSIFFVWKAVRETRGLELEEMK